MERWCTWWEASGSKSRRWHLGRSRAISAGRSACSTSRTARASVTQRALRKQHWSKRSGGGWNGQQRCARCKMVRSGYKGWSTTTVQMPYASWTLPMPLSTSMRSDRSCEQQEADCRSPGWRECCTGSNTRDLTGCSNTWRGWPLAIPVQPSRRTSPICRSGKRTCSTQHTRRQAGPLARGAWKAPTSWLSKHGSRALACAGVVRTLIPCWCYVTPSVIESGSRPGRRRWLSDKRCAPSVGKQRASNGSTVPFGSSSFGEYGSIGCLIPLLLLPLHRRLRPSARSNQLIVLALAIPGANPFSDVLLRPVLLQKRLVQKNETHPWLSLALCSITRRETTLSPGASLLSLFQNCLSLPKCLFPAIFQNPK